MSQSIFQSKKTVSRSSSKQKDSLKLNENQLATMIIVITVIALFFFILK
jgi:hypothetical protein